MHHDYYALTGPSDDTHIANLYTATSPTLKQPNDDTHGINSDAAASPTIKDAADGPTATAAPAADADGDTTRKRKRNRRGGGPTKAKEQRRREAYNTASDTPAIGENGRGVEADLGSDAIAEVK